MTRPTLRSRLAHALFLAGVLAFAVAFALDTDRP